MSTVAVRTARPARAVWAAGAAAAVVGLVLAVTAEVPPGLDPLELEDAVDVAGILLVAAVGLPLTGDAGRRRLGLALASLAAVLGTALLLDGIGRAAYGHAPGASRALLVIGSALLPLLVALVVVVIPILAPDGHPLSRVAERAAGAAVLGAALLVLADVLQAGPVDEDAPAIGSNPLGIETIGGALDAVRVLAALALAAGVIAGLTSVVVRLTRRDSRTRARTAWLAAGVALLVLALALDSELQERGGAAYGVVAAAVALGGLAACLRRATAPASDQP